MRINNNMMALNNQRQIGINHINAARSIERLSSGMQINRARDNAAGLAISERMRTQIAGLNMGRRNAQDGVSLLQTAEGGMQTLQNILQSMRELAVRSASDTHTPHDRAIMDMVSSQLSAGIDHVASTTEFNTMPLLDGSIASVDPQIDGVDYRGPLYLQTGNSRGDIVTIDIDALDSGTLGIAHASAGAADGINLLSHEGATDALGRIDNALRDISMQRAQIGARQNALEFRMENNAIQAENAAAAESRIRDADMALEAVRATTSNILLQASIALQAQANAVPERVLQLIS